jgi:hypothetical protein
MDDRRTCTAGIARRDADGGWHLVGSGVCLAVGPRAFVISAGRLLATVSDSLWLGGAGKHVRLLGAATFQGSQNVPAELHRMDMGFAPLLQHEVEYLDEVTYVSADAIDVEEYPVDASYLAIAAADAGGAATRTIQAHRASPDAYREAGLAPTTHVVLDVPGQIDACGLIGAGVWRPGRGGSPLLLTGIVVQVQADGAAGTRLIATRTPYIVVGILGFLGMPTHPSAYRPKDVRRGKRRLH